MAEIATDAERFAASLSALKDGDTLSLAPGEYGEKLISRKVFPQGVIIKPEDAENPPVFDTLGVNYSEGIELNGLHVKLKPNGKTVGSSSVLRLNNTKRVNLVGCDLSAGPAIVGIPQDSPASTKRPGDSILGLPIARALTLWYCEETTVKGCDLHDTMRGVVADYSPALKFVENDIHDLRTSPFMGSGLDDLLFARNRSWNSRPWKFGGSGDHGDYIHIFPTKGSGKRCSGISILDNLFDQGDGDPILGIYLDDGGVSLGFERVEIAGNTWLIGSPQAIRLENVINSLIQQNRAIQTGGDSKAGPSLILRGVNAATLKADENTGISIIGNEMHDVFGFIANKLNANYGNNVIRAPVTDAAMAKLEAQAIREKWLNAYRPKPVVDIPEIPTGENVRWVTIKPGEILMIRCE